MNLLATTLRRVFTAFMLCLSFPPALIHAQNISFRIEAPKNFDYEAENFYDLREEIGTLKITFSGNSMFQNVDNYARYNLDLNEDFQYKSNSSNAIKYQSYSLNIFNTDDNGVCWGNNNLAAFNVRSLQRSLGVYSSSPIYYRIYSPHFNRIIVGKIIPSNEQRIYIHHNEWAKSRRVAFLPVVGREGNPILARLAPDLHTGSVSGSVGSRNMYDLRKEQPFVVYAQVGDTLRYLVAPQEDNLALHADSIVVTDTTTCVTTDYRKATLCYFYITDTKGNLCPTTGEFGSVYYPHQRITIDKNNSSAGSYGYGFYNVNDRFDLTAPDGTKAAYVLPGTQTFQFGRPIVETTDPDFLMPYNAQAWYVIKEATIPASTEPVSISLGKSTPVRTITTLADAAPYADNLKIEGFSMADRPYAWSDNTRIDIKSREISRQVQGNDLIITTLVEGSNESTNLELTAKFKDQETFSPGINAKLSVYSYYYWPGIRVDNEFHFTQNQFWLHEFSEGKNPNFSTLHPVKFVIPCHLLQEGYQLKSDYPTNFIATHHEGCAKSLAVGSKSPVPYDTLTVILPEGQYSWYMLKENNNPDDAHKNFFTLDATGPAEQHLADNQFSLLRVVNLGVDSVYIFNDVPEYKSFRSYEVISDKEGNNQIYYAAEVIPLHAGYNEHAIKYRQIKIEKDTFNAIRYWVQSPHYYKDEEGIYHPSYTDYTVGSYYNRLDSMTTTTPDNVINLSTGSRANIATSVDFYNYPAYLIEVAPSNADTIVSIYDNKFVRTHFRFNGERNIPGFVWLNMCYNGQQTHVAIKSNDTFYRRGYLCLLPGHYTMEGVVWGETVDDETDSPLIPIKIAFDIPSSGVIELNPSVVEAIPSVSTDESGTPQVQACYTIDGRRIAAPQSGVNIIKMSDGTVRKVMVK